MNQEGIYECHSRMQGDYPVFIPHKSLLAEKLVEEAHFHGGVGGGREIIYGQKKRSVLDTNFKANCEKNN